MRRRDFLACSIVTPLVTACGGAAQDAPQVQRSARSRPLAAVGEPHALAWDAAGNWTMDGSPFRFFGGELHPARIPSQYWDHRIKMVKALGCNTISLYVMWNFHERADGSFDFDSPDKDIGHFVDLCAQNGMWVIFRPGPYVCAEWDFGGLPPRMLADPAFRDAAGNLQIRGNFANYMAAVQQWNAALHANVVSGRTLSEGGPILLVSLENEYTFWSPYDTSYITAIAAQWTGLGYAGKFCVCEPYANGFKTNNIPVPANTAYALTADGAHSGNYTVSAANYRVGVFGSECYPGWICSWGESGQTLHAQDFADQVATLARTRRSFVLYVAHGGTNFGGTGGGNGIGHQACQPVLTTYDYGAPIAESGGTNPNFAPTRDAFVANAPDEVPFAPLPAPVLHIADGEVSAVSTGQFTFCTLFSAVSLNVQDAVARTIEWLAWTANQAAPAGARVYPTGVVVYETRLPAAGGNWTVTFDRAPDFAVPFVDGVRVPNVVLSTVQVGALSPVRSFTVSGAAPNATLRLVCMPFGRANFGAQSMNGEGRGLSGNVYANGQALGNWSMALAPLSAELVSALTFVSQLPSAAQPFFARATVDLPVPKDMYIDMSAWGSGYVFVNGRNLGRYWTAAGPQKRLYCPGVWLQAGSNSIVVFELTQAAPGALTFRAGSALPLNVTRPVSTAPVPPVAANTTYLLQNVHSGLYLDILPPVEGATVTYPGLTAMTGAATQGWLVNADASGNLSIVNTSSGAGLDVADQASSPGSPVILYAPNGGTNQAWQAAGVSTGVYTLTGVQSQLRLDVSGKSKSATSITPASSTAAIVIDTAADPGTHWPYSQQWRFVPAVFANGIYTITVAASNLRLGTYQGAVAQGTRLAIAAPTGGTEQQWQLLNTGAGIWQFRNVKSGLLMDVSGQNISNSAQLLVWPANGGTNQQFLLVPRADGRSFAIQGVQSSRMIDANGSATSPTSYGSTNVSAITLWDDNSGANQSWVFSKVG